MCVKGAIYHCTGASRILRLDDTGYRPGIPGRVTRQGESPERGAVRGNAVSSDIIEDTGTSNENGVTIPVFSIVLLPPLTHHAFKRSLA